MDRFLIGLLAIYIIFIIHYIYVIGVNLPFLIQSSACIYLLVMGLLWDRINALILDKIKSKERFIAFLYKTTFNLILIAYPIFALYIYFKYRGAGWISLLPLIMIPTLILVSLIDHFLKSEKR